LVDFVLGALIVALAVRGWMRGFVRESISFAVLVVGLLVAFRLSTPGGLLFESLAGTSADGSRLAAGLVIFLLISATAGIVSSFLHRGIRVMPGLPTVNRLAGAGLAVLLGVVAVTLILSVAGVLSLPSAVASPVAESALATRLVDPAGPVQDAVGVISGDRVMEHVLKLQDAVGERRLVADDGVVFIPASDEGDLDPSDEKNAAIRDLVERERAAAGAGSLQPSPPLDQLALDYAVAVYRTGRFSNVTAAGDSIDDRLVATGFPVTTADQTMVLASSPKSAHEGLMADDETTLIVVNDRYRRIGVGAVNGPLGWIIVTVYTG
jgi:uncharacterized membrane protein required for colicin V production